MKIIKVEPSSSKNKRFKVSLDDGSSFHFGLKGGSTYLDHKDETKRKNYRLRHRSNPLEKYLIDHFKPSAALFSYYLLWGDSVDMQKNIKWLNKKL